MRVIIGLDPVIHLKNTFSPDGRRIRSGGLSAISATQRLFSGKIHVHTVPRCFLPVGRRAEAPCQVIGPNDSTALPVLCLPGLTRTTDDFDDIARAMPPSRLPRKVVAIDYRGRGLSDYDPDPAKYAVPVELGDVLAIAASLGISAPSCGTSRGAA
jgi:pimeloyl-ACP methyl ester carboxylesterase